MIILINKLKNSNKNYLKVKGIIKARNSEIVKIELKWKNSYYQNFKVGNILKLKLIEKIYKVLIKNILNHPYKKIPEHIEFFKIND